MKRIDKKEANEKGFEMVDMAADYQEVGCCYIMSNRWYCGEGKMSKISQYFCRLGASVFVCILVVSTHCSHTYLFRIFSHLTFALTSKRQFFPFMSSLLATALV